MGDFLLPLILITPFIASVAIAMYKSQSLWFLVVVVLGAISGGIFIALSGICWLQVLHHRWMESQAAGFIFVPITLPICVYTGAVAGVSLVTILNGHPGSQLASPMFELIAVVLTILLSGLIPSAIAVFPSFYTSIEVSQLPVAPILVAIFVVLGGVASSWLASELAYLLVAIPGVV